MADNAPKKRKSLLDYFPSAKKKARVDPGPMEVDEEEQSPEKAKETVPEKVEESEAPEEKIEGSEQEESEASEGEQEESEGEQEASEAEEESLEPEKTAPKPPKKKRKKSPVQKGIKKRKKNAFELLRNAAKRKSIISSQDSTEAEVNSDNERADGEVDYAKYGLKPLLQGQDLRWLLRAPEKPYEIKDDELLWERNDDPIWDHDGDEDFTLPAQKDYIGKMTKVNKTEARKLHMLERFALYRKNNQYARDIYNMAPLIHFERDELGFDPRFSMKDTNFTSIGDEKDSAYTKQDMKTHYHHYSEARKRAYMEHNWELWCDPSAQTQFHHPDLYTLTKGATSPIVEGNPHKMDLRKVFGDNVEFIYLSPPWDVKYWGNGVEGYFTLQHLRDLDLRFVMDQGFIFLWAPFAYFTELVQIMEDKGFDWADTVCMVGTDNHQNVLNVKRNPFAEKSDYAGRMSGHKFHGFLFKCFERVKVGNWVLGNQIQKDVQFTNIKTDTLTGQFRYDHSFVYELYNRIIAQKPTTYGGTETTCQALHLYCDENLNHKYWKGVRYGEDPPWMKEMNLTNPDLSILDRDVPMESWVLQMPISQHLVDAAGWHEEELESKDDMDTC